MIYFFARSLWTRHKNVHVLVSTCWYHELVRFLQNILSPVCASEGETGMDGRGRPRYLSHVSNFGKPSGPIRVPVFEQNVEQILGRMCHVHSATTHKSQLHINYHMSGTNSSAPAKHITAAQPRTTPAIMPPPAPAPPPKNIPHYPLVKKSRFGINVRRHFSSHEQEAPDRAS